MESAPQRAWSRCRGPWRAIRSERIARAMGSFNFKQFPPTAVAWRRAQEPTGLRGVGTGSEDVVMDIGYSLASEEHSPMDLVRLAVRAEEAGFRFALISDHYHPWVPRQGHSPFVWTVIGAIAHATERLRLGTGVTCPTMRIHPAIIAQAAATAALLMPGRFFLGVGTGENLNEHILGDPWPAPDTRLERLEEAVAVMRQLWRGGPQNHRGRH